MKNHACGARRAVFLVWSDWAEVGSWRVHEAATESAGDAVVATAMGRLGIAVALPRSMLDT